MRKLSEVNIVVVYLRIDLNPSVGSYFLRPFRNVVFNKLLWVVVDFAFLYII